MKKLLLILPVILVILTACPGKKDVPDTPANRNKIVSQFVYDGMSSYYLWANEMTNKKPAGSNPDPETYFKSVLNATDKSHGWSWITDDVNALLADFSGTPVAFGWSVSFLRKQAGGQEFVAVIKYVFPNTPAVAANIQRGNIIDKIDGAAITLDNYQKLFGSASISVTVYDQDFSNGKTVNIVPVQINTNPVLVDTVYAIGGRKIGYLFYTDFISEYNGKLYDAFTKFKTAGVTDLVLDLRYNHGGSISAAVFLASLMAPQTVVQNKSVFTILSYNNAINQIFDKNKWSRKDSLGMISGSLNPLNANLNLNKVYIIATGDSYSASELTTFCLKPYMTVEHIGDSTGGKYTGSWTVHAYDDQKGVTVYDATSLTSVQRDALRDWAMQPIVAKYTDKNGNDFSGAGTLIPTTKVATQENSPSSYKPIGDTGDYLLAKAISLITGIPVSPAINTTLPRTVYGSKDAKLFGRIDGQRKEAVQLTPPQGMQLKGHELLMLLQNEAVKIQK
jgi:C-terminal processing protease CtpA/Prc